MSGIHCGTAGCPYPVEPEEETRFILGCVRFRRLPDIRQSGNAPSGQWRWYPIELGGPNLLGNRAIEQSSVAEHR
jgi:hypothetical protein